MNLHVNEIKMEDNKVKIYTEESQLDVTATGTMVVDSDHMQFVYLLDDGEFHHLRFVQETWPMLKQYQDKDWYLYGTLQLDNFKEELQFLLENIEGNYNYGKEFTESVEHAFEL